LRFSISANRFNIASVVLVLVAALATRLYALGSFPYFPTLLPWHGAQTTQAGLQGLYIDEYEYLQRALQLFRGQPQLSLHQPPLAISLLYLSVSTVGNNSFAVRLPFALFSSFTAAFVYLIAKRLGNSITAGLASAVFYIAMVPALIYGRMAFLDNVSAFFFVGMLYFILRFKGEQGSSTRNRWILAASFFAGLSVLSKITGIVSVVFFLIFLYREKVLSRYLRFLAPAIVLAVLFPLVVLFALGLSPSNFVTWLTNEYPIFQVGNELSVWRYFFLSTFPSGFSTWWGGTGGFPKPELWYVLGYITLLAVAVKEYSTYYNLILAVATFVAFVPVVSPLGSYYLIFIQPLIAIPFGPGIRKLLDMPFPASLGVYTFLYVPLAISVGIGVISGPGQLGNPFINDPTLFLWKTLLVLFPLAVLFLSIVRFEGDVSWKRASNSVLIAMLLVILFAASYLTPDLYPQWFFPKYFTP
jgi:4-amino-4-deoxy-L-arabinose transferase-like glycosyltransferase